jgi:hypothetical protein
MTPHSKLEAKRSQLVITNERFKMVFDAIREFMEPPEAKRRPIGFQERAMERIEPNNEE